MNLSDLKNELLLLNDLIYYDENEFLREKCADEKVLKKIIEKFEEKLETISNYKLEDQIFIYGSIGNLNRIIGNTTSAIECLEYAVSLSEENKKIANIIRLGEALKYDGQHELALKKFEQAINMCTLDLNYTTLLDFAYQHKGKCLLELGQPIMALDNFQQALLLRQVKGDSSLIESTQKAVKYTKQYGGI